MQDQFVSPFFAPIRSGAATVRRTSLCRKTRSTPNPTRARSFLVPARRVGGECAAIELLLDLPARRNAVAKQDEDAEAFAHCRSGLEPLVEHRQRRGDLAGALEAADELFLTGTAAEVTPVREVDNRRIGKGEAGPITKKIQEVFFKAVKGQEPKYREWLTPYDLGK